MESIDCCMCGFVSRAGRSLTESLGFSWHGPVLVISRTRSSGEPGAYHGLLNPQDKTLTTKPVDDTRSPQRTRRLPYCRPLSAFFNLRSPLRAH